MSTKTKHPNPGRKKSGTLVRKQSSLEEIIFTALLSSFGGKLITDQLIDKHSKANVQPFQQLGCFKRRWVSLVTCPHALPPLMRRPHKEGLPQKAANARDKRGEQPCPRALEACELSALR